MEFLNIIYIQIGIHICGGVKYIQKSFRWNSNFVVSGIEIINYKHLFSLSKVVKTTLFSKFVFLFFL